MDLFRVPSTVTTSVSNCSLICPDGTFIYISFSRLICIKEQESDKKVNIYALEAGTRIHGIECDPDFVRTRYVAASYEDKHVYIWDLDKKSAIFGHAAHVEKNSQQNKNRDMPEPFPICFTLDKKVVSASKNRVVFYCVASNTFKVNTELTRKHLFTVLKASPYDPNIVAGGTKAGLVVILLVKNMTIIRTMRGHDTEIGSLDWIRAPQTPVEEEDLFGLYTNNTNDDEFGVPQETRHERTFDIDEPTKDKSMHEAIENMNQEAFDFAEACQSLKQDIISGKEDVERTEMDFTNVIESQKDSVPPQSDSSEAPSRDNDFKSVENEPISSETKPEENLDDLMLLLSTSLEPRVWIWDTKKGCALDKIHLPLGKQSFKTKTYTAKWLNPFNIITNDQNGSLSLWDIEYRAEDKIMIHKSKREFPSKAIVQLNVDRKTENFWSVSAYAIIARHNIDAEHPLFEYTTISPNIHEFSVNPIDPNLVAVAGYKRISLINVSNISQKYFFMNYMNNQLHSQVLTVAWHPEKENLLAFGTREGRVGILDTNKLHHSAFVMKPFFSNDVYSVTWGMFRANPTEEMAWTLFCCGTTGNAGKLVYFPQQGNNKFAATVVKSFQDVTAVVASSSYLAVGLFTGTIHLMHLSDSSLTPFYTYNIGPKLISGISFTGQKLAVSSFDHQITIFTIVSGTDVTLQYLEGHKNGVTSVSWNLTNPNLLVSCGKDNSVRIWDMTLEEKCVSVSYFEKEVFAAIFHPSDNDVVMVGGLDFMMTLYNYKKEIPDFSKKYVKPGSKLAGVTMAVANETDVVAKTKKEKRKILEIQKRLERSVEVIEVKEENNCTQELIQEIEGLKLDSIPDSNEEKTVNGNHHDKDIPNGEVPKPVKEPKVTKEKTIQLNYSSIFFLTPRELNRDPINLLKTLVSTDSTMEDHQTRHQKLFSDDPGTVRALLNEEHTHQIASNAQSVGHLTLPILTMDLKSVILDKISSKTLTEEYIAVAPFISHMFWRNTCLAFAHQCVEQGLVLKAITYFLCCYEENEAISILCQSNHYTEAIAIAKMRKSKDDPIINEIIKKWTSYLEYCGNFEAAAIVWMTFGVKESALKVLERRNNPSQELQDVIGALKEHMNGTTKQEDD